MDGTNQLAEEIAKRVKERQSGQKDIWVIMKKDNPVAYYAAKILLNNELYVTDQDAHLPDGMRKLYSHHEVVCDGVRESIVLNSLAGEKVPIDIRPQVYTIVVQGCPIHQDTALWIGPGLLWDKATGELLKSERI